MVALNEKHKRFCNEYLIDLNATQAYLRAGYKVSERVAAVNAARLLAIPKVQAYIAERQAQLQAKTAITQERVLAELAAIGFANGSDFARVVDEPTLDQDTGEPKTYQKIELVNTDDLPEEKRKALAGIRYGKYGIVVEACDKVKALELLGKHLGLFGDKASDKDTGGGIIITLKGEVKDYAK